MLFYLVHFFFVPVCARCCYENMCRKIMLSHFPQRIEALNSNRVLLVETAFMRILWVFTLRMLNSACNLVKMLNSEGF